MVIVLDSVSNAGFYLGFIVWGRSPQWPSFLGGSGGHAYTVMITIFLEGKLGILGGKYTLDRTLQTVEVEKWNLQPSLLISVYSTKASRPSNQIIEIKQNKIKNPTVRELTSLLLILTWPRSRTGVYWEYRISIATFLHRL